MTESYCMNCGDTFDREYSHMDTICDFCCSAIEPFSSLKESTDSDIKFYNLTLNNEKDDSL